MSAPAMLDIQQKDAKAMNKHVVRPLGGNNNELTPAVWGNFWE